MLDDLLVSVDDISLELDSVIAGVPKDLEELADPIAGLVLGLFLDINISMGGFQMSENFVQKLQQLKSKNVNKVNKLTGACHRTLRD